MFDNKLSITLGEDQIKWKNRYGELDLAQWRIEPLPGDKSEWVYVGDWLPDNSKPGESYLERKENLLINKYHYWPKDKIE